MKHTLELQTAIENLYTLFVAYPLRDNTDPCSCCHSAYDEQSLHLKPLRKLGADDLWLYAMDALFVWGGSDDFKHFLPRIFELTVKESDTFVDPQVALNKLHHGDWRSWPDAEQRGVEDFFAVVWRNVIESEPHELCGLEMDDWLCGIAHAENLLSPYLDTWFAAESENARLNLAAFIADTDFAKHKHSNGYWSDRRELFDEVAAWVRSDAMKTKMAKVVVDFPEHGFAQRAYVLLP
jgi:hypothetical protein